MRRVTTTALICGITGQDGAYLARYLLRKGYRVFGTTRSLKGNSFPLLRAIGVLDDIRLQSLNPLDFSQVVQAISDIRPSEIYNLSGQSSVGISFSHPYETINSFSLPTLNFLEAIRLTSQKIKFFNAGSGDWFGDTSGKYINELSPPNLLNPYSVGKLAAARQVTIYREVFSIFACTGILFNHESPLRAERFVTAKIINAAYRIKKGSDEKLVLSNLDVTRDWGWAPEYVEAMWRTLQYKTPEDFIISTGVAQSLQSFLSAVFDEVSLDWRQHVVIDRSLARPNDAKCNVGCPDKARHLLEWRPTVIGEDVPRMLINARISASVC